MLYIALGCFGFLTIHLFDIVSMKKWPAVKSITWILGTGLLAYALIWLSLHSDRLTLPVWSTWLGWSLFLTSFPILIYALFVNLPFHKTYVAAGVGDRLITTGLYALVRHPGVHWFSLALISLVLVSKSSGLLTAVPVFIFMDVVLVMIQDKWFFTRMFRDYARYQQTTPMLIPNRQSIKAFISSFETQ
ncbi:MAG: methyltransferase [Dehalococcoidales bacterium]|nr:methyltransferase [Dehalococcoidales bacterium]